jgi:hypothetical protein
LPHDHHRQHRALDGASNIAVAGIMTAAHLGGEQWLDCL